MPFEIVRNDITRMRVDAIVNAANKSLLGGGGVDGAIHRAAGPALLAECRTLHGCETGQAKLTRGYNLPAKYVIHTVGPIWRGGGAGEEALLSACYRNSLILAAGHDLESVAFPLISAGVYGYPVDQAVRVASREIESFLVDHDMLVYLVVFDRASFTASRGLVSNVQAYIDDVYADEHTAPRSARLMRQLAEQSESYSLPDVYSEAMPAAPSKAPDWEEMLKQTDEGFSQALLRLIDEKGLTDAQCYKRANVDRKLFSKIRSNIAYKPSKPTVFAFAVALKLSLDETKKLLEKAGFALTHASRLDIAMEYFITHGIYSVFEINEVLFQFDLPLLGSGGA